MRINILFFDPGKLISDHLGDGLLQSTVVTTLCIARAWEEIESILLLGKKPDVFFYSISQTNAQDLTQVHRFVQQFPDLKSILLVKNPKDLVVLYGLVQGANGVFEQETFTVERFISIAEHAYRGEAILTPKLMAIILDQISQSSGQAIHHSLFK